jgi:alkylation response protein AidB-like acyl-CoA dehydrogenase
VQQFSIIPYEPPAEVEKLRAEVRAFLATAMANVPVGRRARTWASFDPEFSRKLGAQGWIGMSWPRPYGGGRSMLERYVVTEELLAAGAPVGAHWIADRQSGPLLLRFGTEAQRARYLPAIARGESYFCIGMSEPGSGSDLASIRTRAAKVEGGYRVSGQKIWTTNAHKAHYMIALLRTGEGSQRQEGLSQLLIDLKLPGITIRPIMDLTGERDFNEVFFDDAFVADDALVGKEGEGWKQVTAELSLERSGAERFLSSFPLVVELLKHVGPNPPHAIRVLLGRVAAELWTLRQMSLSVAAQLAEGREPTLEAAIVKDLGNGFEQELPRAVQALSEVDLADGTAFAQTLGVLLQFSPAFSLRGGTREILRGIIARGLGLR